MNSSVIRERIRKRGLYLGVVPGLPSPIDSSTLLTLDHDLDVFPEVGRRMTVGELAGHVDDLAARLRAAGVRPEDRVVIFKAPNFDLWMLGTATARLGAVPVMLSHHLDSATISALLGRLDRPHLLADADRLDALAGVPLAELTRQVISVTGSRPGAVPLADLAGSPPVQPVFQGLDEPALITHTSGTTGVPKLVVHTPRTMRLRLRPQLVLLGMMWNRGSVAIHCPFGHSRTFAAMSLCLLKAMPVLAVNNSDPDHTAQFFARYQPWLIEALPNSFLAWEDLTSDPRQPFASVKYFSSTFDAIHPRTISRLLESSRRRVPLFYQIYGQSEVGPAIGRPYFRRSARRMDGRCVGYPMLGGPRVRVVSRDGARPSKASPGYIEVRWKALLHTYLGEEDKHAANLRDGWWRMGDVGYRTRFGCLHMLDREVDVIPGVGSTLEIEDLLMSRLAELNEMVVIPGPHSEPVPVICTTQDQPLDLDRWRDAVADLPQLADPIQLPLAELPRTATLKVQRIKLSRRLHEQMEKQA
jgi:acyl-coenzyme A synthetase/AMP-(fatty) acid ligase